MLELAVISSWTDLMPTTQAGAIHIEYDFVADCVDHVQVWSSVSRGHWLLACSYWMSASNSHDAGIQFHNGYESKALAHILNFVMKHQHTFSFPENLGRKKLLQLSTPTPEASMEATTSVNEGCRWSDELSLKASVEHGVKPAAL